MANAESAGSDAAPAEKTWTFFGHWENSRIVVEYVEEGVHSDPRIDTGYWDQGLWADSGTGATLEEAEARAKAEYELANDSE